MAPTSPALATPASYTADFSLITASLLVKHHLIQTGPLINICNQIDTQNVSFVQQITDIQRLMQQSGLKY